LFPFDNSLATSNFGFLLGYLYETQLCDLRHLNKISFTSKKECLEIDSSTWRNLEITENMRTKEKRGSLLGVLDQTSTAMGARYLRKSLERPLANAAAIVNRQNAVNILFNDAKTRDKIYSLLKNIRDIERLTSKIVYGTITPRDLIALSSSLSIVAALKQTIASLKSIVLQDIYNRLNPLPQIVELISNSIIDDPPAIIREGGFIKKGYNEEADRLRSLQTNAKSVLAEVEQKEKEKTGIKNLRIGFNKVFGYYIEVTNSFLSQVPEDYIRKQTLVNAERFITPELKKIEEDLLSASDKLIALENELYQQIVDFVGNFIIPIKDTASAIGYIDMLISFAIVSVKNSYVQPDIDLSDTISIKNGRHPVVESLMKSELFIPNDTFLNTSTDRMAVITGPNMAGKSTYMRQLAITVIMAQIGCFVPAKECTIPLFDKIFTRIGASDDLVSGDSTFMIEMKEANTAITEATPNSLILFDELGRGTATYDGMSLAQAILEYIHDNIKAKTLFSTHYHELTVLEHDLNHLKNVHVSATLDDGKLVFLHKVKNGSVDKSYGIHVASLAHLPTSLIDRANDILSIYEKSNKKDREFTQTSLFLDFEEEKNKESVIEERLKEIDPLNITPIEALNILYELKKDYINANDRQVD
jgi:DNA mismatch repair protein MutS